jgi:hypothetical protein
MERRQRALRFSGGEQLPIRRTLLRINRPLRRDECQNQIGEISLIERGEEWQEQYGCTPSMNRRGCAVAPLRRNYYRNQKGCAVSDSRDDVLHVGKASINAGHDAVR